MNKSDAISILIETVEFIEELQQKAKSAGTYTKLQDKAIKLLEIIDMLKIEE